MGGYVRSGAVVVGAGYVLDIGEEPFERRGFARTFRIEAPSAFALGASLDHRAGRLRIGGGLDLRLTQNPAAQGTFSRRSYARTREHGDVALAHAMGGFRAGPVEAGARLLYHRRSTTRTAFRYADGTEEVTSSVPGGYALGVARYVTVTPARSPLTIRLAAEATPEHAPVGLTLAGRNAAVGRATATAMLAFRL